MIREKSKKAYHEREDTKKLCFPWLQKNIIFIGDATYKREIVFQKKKKIGKQPIKDKPYIYQGFLLTKVCSSLTNFFCAIKY